MIPQDTAKARINLRHFIGKMQLSIMGTACRGEEGEYFRQLFLDLKAKISEIPKTYETDGQGDDALVRLHYFKDSSDWYIIECDAGCEEDDDPGVQIQAFGFSCLNMDYENAELGYINIEELIRYGVELDLHWTPVTLGEIRKNMKALINPTEKEIIS